jgi:hypothetical protein
MNSFFNNLPASRLHRGDGNGKIAGKTGPHAAMAEPKTKPAVSPGFTRLVSLSTLLVFVVVVLSAYIRLGDTGLDCADWPASSISIKVHCANNGAWIA